MAILSRLRDDLRKLSVWCVWVCVCLRDICYSLEITCPRADLCDGWSLCCVNTGLGEKLGQLPSNPPDIETSHVCVQDVSQKRLHNHWISLIWINSYKIVQTLPYRCPEGLFGWRPGRILQVRCNSVVPEGSKKGKLTSTSIFFSVNVNECSARLCGIIKIIHLNLRNRRGFLWLWP